MTGVQTCRFNLTIFLCSFVQSIYALPEISTPLGKRNSCLLHKPELHVYFCNTTTLIGPVSTIREAGIVQVTYD